MSAETLRCWIYRARDKGEMYLYVDREDDFAAVPKALLRSLGPLERVMEVVLRPDRPLAREDVAQVMAQLRERGFFLQLPPRIEPKLYRGD